MKCFPFYQLFLIQLSLQVQTDVLLVDHVGWFKLTRLELLTFNEPLVVHLGHLLKERFGETVLRDPFELDRHLWLVVKDAFSKGALGDLAAGLLHLAAGPVGRKQVGRGLSNAGVHCIDLFKLFLRSLLHEFRVEDDVKPLDLMLILEIRSIQDVVLARLQVVESERQARLLGVQAFDETDDVLSFLETLSGHDKLQIRVLQVFLSKLLFLLIVLLGHRSLKAFSFISQVHRILRLFLGDFLVDQLLHQVTSQIVILVDALHLQLVNLVLLGVEELHVHLVDAEESHISLLGNGDPGDAPFLIRDLVRNSSVVKLFTRVTDGKRVEELEEVLKQHPETTIVRRSQSRGGDPRGRVVLGPLPQLLVDVRVLVPSRRVVGPRAFPLLPAPWISEAHQIPVLISTLLDWHCHSSHQSVGVVVAETKHLEQLRLAPLSRVHSASGHVHLLVSLLDAFPQLRLGFRLLNFREEERLARSAIYVVQRLSCSAHF